ncbi:hypothetical protein GCM10010985_32960 [Caballeronia grimmiae]|uniref:Acyl-CoA dehydrogenase/oxidase N-terminal domain-containing protein n=1 Tax=Caballeronia grimmiae TaxID=1071679 RepID=A0ABQ1RNI3_9BURK|nr:hypothetical protein GCM10010985_32960 [Caballeronia grimmiae]
MTDTTNPFFTEQQTLIRDSARRVAREIVAPTAAERDLTSAWPRKELKALAELGFLGMLIPEQYGAPARASWSSASHSTKSPRSMPALPRSSTCTTSRR